ncbi:probable glycosyltransferase STELLO2 [Lingula anatina]|uniref:Probable glycosyltransferase STELLO2 n=1 Tax=Lingula anatina TaxID=7574 RepID=A0A1S3HSZ2_LINAN|nr:probable glycosyltransferase STELLO2 [Lingula anatina]XP_013389155.1 probable glycosyltransferase STELLO2 [Lingula anatina]XP_013389156.1 probable glycosyltransferase STELLO2 [Lingula anatina]XP_013389157.1 probable glycosyltransferase STELLO2 [Lingula anatina]|eukprot:XP_013389154.1 probable glycosyltransferase STELLO2 [Lingula anatina]
MRYQTLRVYAIVTTGLLLCFVGFYLGVDVCSIRKDYSKPSIDNEEPKSDNNSKLKNGPDPADVKGADPAELFSSANFGALSGKRFEAIKVRAYKPDDGARDNNKCSPFHTSPTEKKCDKWVVITTIFKPSKLAFQLSKKKDWCVVVVADKKGFPTYDVPNVKYLTVQEQEQCEFNICKLLPWNHFGRKNIGFLYAMKHGAQLIYDTDDDNELKESLFIPDPAKIEVKNVKVQSKTLWNPYPFFSQYKDSWPRGFPLEKIKDNATKTQSVTDQLPNTNIGIIQSLADHEPDVDALYRLTQPLPFGFRQGNEYYAVPYGIMVPYNAQATLHTYDTFFAMYLPITVTGRVTDIWRAYFTVRLLWDIKRSLVFASPWVTQIRNAHNWLADFYAEWDLYFKSTQLAEFLQSWKPSRGGNIAHETKELYVALYETTFIESLDVRIIDAWLKDLECMGYKFPKVS